MNRLARCRVRGGTSHREATVEEPHRPPWLEEFERRAGRPLRVLHIGNIANNAYNNAKIQRAAGIDADVLSFDYYHIMACPEWEDADFEGDVGDDMFPDWWAVNLRGFERPRWFAQGPFDACLRYLLARSSGTESQGFWWRMLEFERWLLCRRSRLATLVRLIVRGITGVRIAYVTKSFSAVVSGWLARRFQEGANGPFSIALFLDGPMTRWGARLSRFSRTADIAADETRHARARRKRSRTLLPRAERLLAGVGRQLEPEDLVNPFRWWWHPYLRLLLDRYDVVQAYATYTLLPMLAGREDFVAYEHGTIRAIPFEENAQGRLCALTYRAASAVLVTNSDNIEAARRLQIGEERLICLPHAFESDRLLRFAATTPACRRQEARAVFFSPSRQDWVRHDPSLSKGNDQMIRALALALARGYKCQLQLIEWGRDVGATRALIEELGLRDHIQWLPKMRKRELWGKYLSVDCVLDQFVVPAMGGVTFEAMMLGRRVISSIDEGQASEFFGEVPPIFNAADPQTIAEAMGAVVSDLDDLGGRGRANQDWMRRYHSQARIVSIQLETYGCLLHSCSEHEILTPRDVRPWLSRRPVRASPRDLTQAAACLGGTIRGGLTSLPQRAVRLGRALRHYRFPLLFRTAGGLFALAKRLARSLLFRCRWLQLRLQAALDRWGVLSDWLDVVRHRGSQWLFFPVALYQHRGAWRRRPRPGALSGLPREIVMLVVSDLRIDPRVERAARAAASAGYGVKVIWPEPGPPYHAAQPIDWGPGIRFQPLPSDAFGFVLDFPWVLEKDILDAARRERPFAFHCHDLTTSIIGLAAAREVGSYCVCDFHEWYSENVSWDASSGAWRPHGRFKRGFYRWMERVVMSRADAVVTVCDSIAGELTETLSVERRPVTVIRNIPSVSRSAAVYPSLKETLGLSEKHLLVLWQGGTGPSRMIEPIIRALAYSPDAVFTIRGPSLEIFGEGYRSVAREAGADDRLFLLPPVPSRDVVNAAFGADVGVWTLPNLSKNFFYALPNKIFEYLAAGLPVLAADYPEARKMVEWNGVGLCFDPYDPRSIAARINRLIEEPGLLQSYRDAIPAVLDRIDAGREWEKLLKVYDGLGRPGSTSR